MRDERVSLFLGIFAQQYRRLIYILDKPIAGSATLVRASLAANKLV